MIDRYDDDFVPGENRLMEQKPSGNTEVAALNAQINIQTRAVNYSNPVSATTGEAEVPGAPKTLTATPGEDDDASGATGATDGKLGYGPRPRNSVAHHGNRVPDRTL